MLAFQSCKKPVYDELTFKIIERFSYDLEMKTREQNRKNGNQGDMIGLSNGDKRAWLLVGSTNAWLKSTNTSL